jgi:ribosomal protein L31E
MWFRWRGEYQRLGRGSPWTGQQQNVNPTKNMNELYTVPQTRRDSRSIQDIRKTMKNTQTKFYTRIVKEVSLFNF